MKGLICENCGTVLALDGRNGDAANGENSAWITIEAGGLSVDACSRSCAVELLGDDGPLRPVIDAWLEAITEIARSINGEDGDDGDET